MTKKPFIHFALPEIGEEEIAEVVATLRSGWLTTGPRAAQFEREFREYVGSPFSVALNSCTAGLHVALVALGIGPGDEVITTPLTFCATVNTILHTGATPVLADIGLDLNISVESIERVLSSRTKAIIPVHLAGLPCDMDPIWALASRHGLKIIEDAAHAVGASYHGCKIGSGKSDAVSFSFYATKNVSTGEGGMVTANSHALADSMRSLGLHGISRDAWNRYSEQGSWYYDVTAAGFKYNLSDLAAAIGIHQLRKLDRMNARRRQIAQSYGEAFEGLAEVQLPPGRDELGHAWHLYMLRLNLDLLSKNRAEIFEDLWKKGIGCSVHFIPIPLHSYFKALNLSGESERALSEYPRLLSLPLHSGMSDEHVKSVIDAVRSVVAEARKPIIAGRA
jgi:dTDP-4-amino-4,6-dideoxygalactose transaminase